MSIDDDGDFGAQIVEQCAKIVGTEVGKLIIQLNVEKQERQRLQTRVQTLETELNNTKAMVDHLIISQKSPCECQQLLTGAFNAALTSISNPLPEDLRENLKPYFNEDTQSSIDLLTVMQRAFVKHTCKSSLILASGERMSQSVIEQIIQEGVENRIWTSDFTPTDKTSFEGYLYQRIKNEKRGIKRRQSLESTPDLVDKYLNDTVSKSMKNK